MSILPSPNYFYEYTKNIVTNVDVAIGRKEPTNPTLLFATE